MFLIRVSTSRGWHVDAGALKPELTERDPIVANLAPGPEIGASPGLANNPDAGMFDRHDILLVRTAQIEPHGAMDDALIFSGGERSDSS
jgi:hypothetical protein